MQVNISLIEHDRGGKHIGLFQKIYEPVMQKGAGSPSIPVGDRRRRRRHRFDIGQVEIYAVNKIFNDRYGSRAPPPANQFSRTTIRNDDPKGDPLNGRLQRCYKANSADNNGGCVIARPGWSGLPLRRRPGSATATWPRPCCTRRPARPTCPFSRSAPAVCTVDLATSTGRKADFYRARVHRDPHGTALRQGPIVKANGHLIEDGPEVKKDDLQLSLGRR